MIEERENREKVIVAVEDEVTAEKEEVIVDAKEVIVIEEKEMTDLINGEDHLNPRRNQIRIRNNQGELLLKRNDQTQKEEIPVIHLKKVSLILKCLIFIRVQKSIDEKYQGNENGNGSDENKNKETENIQDQGHNESIPSIDKQEANNDNVE